jgi:hypothetical protein
MTEVSGGTPWPADDDCEALLDRVVDLTCERNAYRLVAQQAIHYCHALYDDLTALRVRYKRLLGDLRVLRAQQSGPGRRAV